MNLTNNEKWDLAYNPNTPTHILELLAKDEDSIVRYWVTYNPNTPPHVLELLANDEVWDVRWNVAENLNTPNYIHYYFLYNQYLNYYEPIKF